MMKRISIVLGAVLVAVVLAAVVMERIFGIGIFIKK